MPSLKEIRSRRASVISTRQITSAMKMVAAAKLKKAQEAILSFRPYADKLKEILDSVGETLKVEEECKYARSRDKELILMVLITSNRGLCGAFNTNAIKAAIQKVLTQYRDQMMAGQVDFITIGKKGYDFLQRKGYNVISNESEVFDEMTYERISRLAEKIMKLYADEKYDQVDIIYNRFQNAANQILTEEQFLPIYKEKTAEESTATFHVDYIFEPTREYIMEVLIPRSLRLQFYKAILDSYASELGARMTAMHQATDNATELLKELSLQYNKARQAAITKEILEIVSGAEALRSK